QEREHRSLLLSWRYGGLRRLSERVFGSRARDGGRDHPRQPRRRGRGAHGLLVLLRGRASRARPARAAALGTGHALADALAVTAPARRYRRAPLARLARAARRVRVHLRAGASARVFAALRPTRAHHADRTFAPL